MKKLVSESSLGGGTRIGWRVTREKSYIPVGKKKIRARWAKVKAVHAAGRTFLKKEPATEEDAEARSVRF